MRNNTRNTTHNREKRMESRSITMIALMTAVTCVLGPLSIPIGPIPVSLTNFAIYLTVYLLGWKKGSISYLIYLLIGVTGVPVFSSFSGGIGKLLGPTGGYLAGFLFMAVIAGWFIQKFSGGKPVQILLCFLGMILGTAVCYVFGTIWFVKVYAGTDTPYTYGAALAACVYPFIPGDLVKIAAAAFLGPQLRRALIRADLIES